MRLVQQATMAPHRCAVLPQVGNGNASGFFDSGSELDRERVYVSFEAVCEMARLLGWHGPRAMQTAENENASLKARIDQLEAALAEEKRTNDAIEFLGTKDFIARQKRGPKKKEKA